mmetsp:Transcript_3297/g.14367  ORF Transcript_3297/g.14367 Transcript_3297/m.14367 type:complete len:154 (+) Transcript_3297:7903-8364(+)
MTFWQNIVFFHEVDSRVIIYVASVKFPDIRNSIQWDPHGDLKLGCRQIDTRDPFSDRVLNLEAWVQLEEKVFLSIGIVQVLNSSRTNISNVARETLCSLFHLTKYGWVGDSWRALFEYFLKASLRGAVTSVESNCVAIFISHDLNFKMSCLSA